MATQYLVTGHAVGFADDKQPFSFIQGFLNCKQMNVTRFLCQLTETDMFPLDYKRILQMLGTMIDTHKRMIN